MKTILWMFLLGVASAAYAQDKPPSCDELKGPDREVCLKKGGTVKAKSAASGSSSTQRSDAPPPNPSAERAAEPDAKKDYTKPDSK